MSCLVSSVLMGVVAACMATLVGMLIFCLVALGIGLSSQGDPTLPLAAIGGFWLVAWLVASIALYRRGFTA